MVLCLPEKTNIASHTVQGEEKSLFKELTICDDGAP